MNNHTQMLEVVNGFKKVLDPKKNILQCLCNYGVHNRGMAESRVALLSGHT